jgi:nitroreductase
LEAGFYAPTAHNARHWHFIVIDNKDIPSKFGDRAACRILVCGDSNIQKRREYLYQDCAAATQNMLLCIHGLGLGAVWCGIPANSESYRRFKTLLELPKEIIPVAQIAFGYPDEEIQSENQFDKQKVHYNKW